jgi:hypothetical protein
VTARWCQIREVGVEVLATFRTVVLRIGNEQVAGTPGVEVAEIMQRALLALIAIGLVPTTRTGVLYGVATAVKNLWLGEILRACNAFRGIGPIDAGSWHTWILHSNKGGTGTICYKVPLCPHVTRFLYYSVEFFGYFRSVSAWISGSKVKNGTTDSQRNSQMRSGHTFPPAGPSCRRTRLQRPSSLCLAHSGCCCCCRRRSCHSPCSCPPLTEEKRPLAVF